MVIIPAKNSMIEGTQGHLTHMGGGQEGFPEWLEFCRMTRRQLGVCRGGSSGWPGRDGKPERRARPAVLRPELSEAARQGQRESRDQRSKGFSWGEGFWP